MTETNNDLNDDGVVDNVERELVERRLRTQRRLAIGAFLGILAMGFGTFGLLASDMIEAVDVEAMSTQAGWFYSILGGIVAAYMGAEAFLTKK